METENSPYVRIHKLVPLKCLKFVNSFQDINRSLKYLIGTEYQDFILLAKYFAETRHSTDR